VLLGWLGELLVGFENYFIEAIFVKLWVSVVIAVQFSIWIHDFHFFFIRAVFIRMRSGSPNPIPVKLLTSS
jgi:hypothetical protein